MSSQMVLLAIVARFAEIDIMAAREFMAEAHGKGAHTLQRV